MTVMVLVNLIPTIWEFVLDSQSSEYCDHKAPSTERATLYALNWTFCVLYSLEFIIKVT
jgi:hypothetical protein